MELIFIRHAKAEERREGLVDIDRHLTDKGKEKYAKLLPELEEKLGPLKERNFVSGQVRLTEHKKLPLAADKLKLEEPRIHEFIYTGEIEKFLEALKTVQDDATLLVFGHEPTLSEWVYEFTGESRRMRKGSMVSMEVTQRDPLKATFNWQIRT